MKFLLLTFGFWIHLSGRGAAIVDLPAEIQNQLHAGDIIIRKGGGALSYQLMNVSHENYSHCGVIVRHDDQWKVIQSAAGQTGFADGVQLIPLNDFVKYTADSVLFICRPIIDTAKNNDLALRAFHYLEKQVPFDHRFDLMNADRFYCSELLLHIFEDVFGDPVFEIRPKHKTFVPLFATFFDTEKFSPVFNLQNEN